MTMMIPDDWIETESDKGLVIGRWTERQMTALSVEWKQTQIEVTVTA